MPTSEQKISVVTGANRGIGRQVADDLAAAGYRVYYGTRDTDSNNSPVAGRPDTARWITVDVADDESIQSAAATFGESEKRLDVLINNAGIFPDNNVTIADIDRASLVNCFQANTFGPIRVAQAFLPYLQHSDDARIINVSSGYGALGGMSPNVPSYCLSKLTLNGVTIQLAAKLRDRGIAVNSVCPGWVRTDMGGPNATRSIEEGAAGIVWLARDADHELTGKFFRDGKEIDW